jgi:hypothetical protein
VGLGGQLERRLPDIGSRWRHCYARHLARLGQHRAHHHRDVGQRLGQHLRKWRGRAQIGLGAGHGDGAAGGEKMDFRCHTEMLAVLRQARQGFQAPGRPCYDPRPLVAHSTNAGRRCGCSSMVERQLPN